MTSSTRGSRAATRQKILVLAFVALTFAGAHLTFEASSRFAERHLDAYLWKEQDFLRVFSPIYHVNRGAGRLWIYGSSEARESFLPEELSRDVRSLTPYQNSQSIGTLEDGIVVLRYIEGAYGRSAIPDAILLGITARFVADLRLRPSPLLEGIDKYSPHFRVVPGGHPPQLARRSFVESLPPRVELLKVEPDRYRRGLLAIAMRTAMRFLPWLASYRWTWEAYAPAKYVTSNAGPGPDSRERLSAPSTVWALVHRWDPELDRDRVTRELGVYREFAARYGSELYVVNLPEHSWNRELYLPGRYEAYLRIVKEALGDTPFLDLRAFLPDNSFYDESHPTWDGGVRVAREVGTFIESHRHFSQAVRNNR